MAAEQTPALEQPAQGDQPETEIPEDTEGDKPKGKRAGVSSARYPERPYADAISPAHKKALADRDAARSAGK